VTHGRIADAERIACGAGLLGEASVNKPGKIAEHAATLYCSAVVSGPPFTLCSRLKHPV
jgi:hypothetical protein